MSFNLKKNGEVVYRNSIWNPKAIGEFTNTSYPAQVNKEYVWESGEYWLGWEEPLPPEPLTEEQILEKETQDSIKLEAENEKLRLEAYRNESDPLFFKWQRGEIEKQVWLDKVAEIKSTIINNV